MKKVLFAGMNRMDFADLVPAIPHLADGGLRAAVLPGCLSPAGADQAPQLPFFDPGAISHGSNRRSLLRLLPPSIRPGRWGGTLNQIWGRNSSLISSLESWREEYPRFVRQVIQEFEPELVVVSPGSIEGELVRAELDHGRCRVAYFFSQFHEFKSLHAMEPTSRGQVTCLVAGEFGRSRLVSLGFDPRDVVISENPRFNSLLEARSRFAGKPRSGGTTLLYPTQGLPENLVLLQRLALYLTKRPEANLVVRPHPMLSSFVPEDVSPYLAFLESPAASGIRERVRISRDGSLAETLVQASVLVTLSSLTILEALILGVPCVSWHSSHLPDELSFAHHGDVLAAADYGGLEAALDALLSDSRFRSDWLDKHQKAHLKYLRSDSPGIGPRFVRALTSLG